MRRLLALCVMTLALPAWAEGPSPVKVAEMSARAYAAGMAAGDPLLVLSAAKLRKSIAPVAGDRAAVDGVAGQRAPQGWEEMLASAAALAGDDPLVLGLIEDAKVEATKGVASGLVYNIGSLGKRQRRHLPANRIQRRGICRGLCRGEGGDEPEPGSL